MCIIADLWGLAIISRILCFQGYIYIFASILIENSFELPAESLIFQDQFDIILETKPKLCNKDDINGKSEQRRWFQEMKKSLRRFLASTKPLSIIARRRKKAKLHKRFQAWKSSGSCLPMPHLGKQFVIQEYFERFSPDIFVETGTYEGDMVDAMLGNFKKIYSVELNETYFRNAYREFGRHRNVHIF